LAKIRIGMTSTEVQSILGAPTSEKNFESGKRWIPWYYGSDVRRTEWAYKGLGRVLFTGGNQWGAGAGDVQRVDYDPSETGVRAN
jgi:outer membrane protein assembly factor BamE (lipoprotein component of BamABCDE complex)